MDPPEAIHHGVTIKAGLQSPILIAMLEVIHFVYAAINQANSIGGGACGLPVFGSLFSRQISISLQLSGKKASQRSAH